MAFFQILLQENKKHINKQNGKKKEIFILSPSLGRPVYPGFSFTHFSLLCVQYKTTCWTGKGFCFEKAR